MSHTQLPWKAYTDGAIVSSDDLENIAQYSDAWPDGADRITEDNAAFIVTACNAHYGLVGALEALLAASGTGGKGFFLGPTNTDKLIDAREAAKKALEGIK